MFRTLTSSDKDIILEFAYKRERENMFVISSFNRFLNPFLENVYIGYFQENSLTGLATHFGRFNSLVINAQETAVIAECVERIMAMKLPIEAVPSFKRYTLPTIACLRRYRMEPKRAKDETVFLLTKENFVEYPSAEVTIGTVHNVDEIQRLDWLVDGHDPNKEITEKERRRIFPEDMFLFKQNGLILSQANIHGYSKHFAQIGCVGTHPDFRGRGYAKATVSAVCKHWLSRGKQMILFCRNDNAAALRVYEALGFQPFDEFIIAEY